MTKYLWLVWVAIASCTAVSVSAQTDALTSRCDYFDYKSSHSFSGACLITRTTSADGKYSTRVTMPGRELVIVFLEHQGPFHRWLIDGAPAAAIEYDRTHICGFRDDLSLHVCTGVPVAPKTAGSSIAENQPSGNVPFFVGRWYLIDAKVCKGRQEETEGLLVFTERKFFGYENSCDIIRATAQANRIELQLSCMSEGNRSRSRELVQIVQGNRLQITTFDDRQSHSFIYNRCP